MPPIPGQVALSLQKGGAEQVTGSCGPVTLERVGSISQLDPSGLLTSDVIIWSHRCPTSTCIEDLVPDAGESELHPWIGSSGGLTF